ncbi:MAG TPA: hypothetical protein VGJ50_27065 [Streptosporangiaceae bacterium]
MADGLAGSGRAVRRLGGGPDGRPQDPDPGPDLDAVLVSLERLEERICELAAHLAAGTCRFLRLVAEFDVRRGWACWDLPSCAAWLAWKCQVAPGTAREQVRVARALEGLPVICSQFAAGRMSYAKVRALTRIATPQTETGLAQVTGPMTAAQCERFAAAHRTASDAADVAARAARRVNVTVAEDGSVAISARLPAAEGAVVLQALRAAAGDGEHPHRPHRDPAEGSGPAQDAAPAASTAPAAGGRDDATRDGPGSGVCRASLADALVAVAGAYLSAKIATAGNPDLYQVIVHVGPEALTDGPDPPRPPLPPLPARRAFPRKHPAALPSARPPGRSAGSAGIPRSRGVATLRTARRSARQRPGRWPAAPRCRGCCMTTTATCWTPAAGTAVPPPRFAARSGSGTRAAASSLAAGPGAPTFTTSFPGPRAARPGCVI